MRLTWYGTAALLLASGETVIAFDPFLGIGLSQTDPGHVEDADAFAGAADVFVTHGHFDHIIQIPALFARSQATVHATAAPCDTLVRMGFPAERLDLIRPGQTLETGGFQVRTLPARHCRFNAGIVLKTALSPRVWANARHLLRLLRWGRQCAENGEILFYELEAEGKRVQILGSLGLDPAADYPTGADALVLPYQGRSDLPSYAAPIVHRLKPKQVLLDHYDDSFPPMTASVDTEKFAPEGIPCSALQKYETITL